MPLPRAPKLSATRLPLGTGPDWQETLGVRDPNRLGPAEPWLRIDDRGFPRRPDQLERRVDQEWVVDAQGVFRIHAWLSADRAVVSVDQQRLELVDRDGTRQTVWQGPKLRMVHAGGLWGDNWMFAAAPLPDGRWLAALPDTSDAALGPDSWPQELVLFSPTLERLASLLLPERADGAVKRGDPRRYVARDLVPALSGRAVLIPNPDLLLVGVYDDRLAWIGKGSMPSEGGVWCDGEQLLTSSSLANSKVNWSRLEGLEGLWERGSGTAPGGG